MGVFIFMKTLGSVDKVKHRKIRSDRKHKYRHRHGKLVRYIPKRKRGDPIKLRFSQKVPMSPEGYMNWNRHLRSRLHKYVYNWILRIDVPTDRISSREEIGKLAIDLIGYEGDFIMFGYGHGRTPTHCKPIKLCNIKLIDSGEEIVAKVTNTNRLSRYFFWSKR